MADAIPANSIIIWTGGVCPTGYTRFSGIDGKFIVGDATYNAAAGGSSSHSHADLASHNHSVSMSTASTNTGSQSFGEGNFETVIAANWSHSHNISGTSANGIVSVPSQSTNPSYATVILCQRAA